MDKTIPGDLPALWRERAETLRTYGDPNSARLWDIAAVELERAQALFAAETLSLTEAARFRELYETARAAAHPKGIFALDDAAITELADALDQIIEECGAWEADLLVWAMDNGFPDLETVLVYAR